MESLISNDGELYYEEHFLSGQEARIFHIHFRSELDWNEEYITIAGKRIKVPRLVCWHGDPGVKYRYSGTEHLAHGWTSSLEKIKEKIETFADHSFNSVLGNQYQNGQDSMGWHADKEKELGETPCIALLSLGDERLFKVRHNNSTQTIDINLVNGSLIVMAGSLQKHWRHCVPKTTRTKGNRISLSFRNIIG